MNNTGQLAIDKIVYFPVAIIFAYISFILAVTLFGPVSLLAMAVVGALYFFFRHYFS